MFIVHASFALNLNWPDDFKSRVTVNTFLAASQVIGVLVSQLPGVASPISPHLFALKAVSEEGIPSDERLIIEADNFEKARIATAGMLEAGIIPDGIFAVNDRTAIGAMQTLQKKGYHIHEQVAIDGFSDGSLSGLTDPNLSSVDQHGYEMGTMAAEMLFSRILSEEEEYIPVVKTIKLI